MREIALVYQQAIDGLFQIETNSSTPVGFLDIDKNQLAKVGHSVSNNGSADFKIENGKLVAVSVVVNTLKKQQQQLTKKRDKELDNLVIDNVLCDANSVNKISIRHSLMSDTDKAKWISKDNQVIEFSKSELHTLLEKSAASIEEIYMRYRLLKDKLKQG